MTTGPDEPTEWKPGMTVMIRPTRIVIFGTNPMTISAPDDAKLIETLCELFTRIDWSGISDEELAKAVAAAIRQGCPAQTESGEVAALRAQLAEAGKALSWFLVDKRFQVSVGGNPSVVERMIDDAYAILAKLQPEPKEPTR